MNSLKENTLNNFFNSLITNTHNTVDNYNNNRSFIEYLDNNEINKLNSFIKDAIIRNIKVNINKTNKIGNYTLLLAYKANNVEIINLIINYANKIILF